LDTFKTVDWALIRKELDLIGSILSKKPAKSKG